MWSGNKYPRCVTNSLQDFDFIVCDANLSLFEVDFPDNIEADDKLNAYAVG